MTRDEAIHLADKVTRLWPRGAITLEIWTEVLEELHHGPAESALRKLRDSDEHAPSVARFRSVYNGELGSYTERINCTACGGDGWITLDPKGKSRDMKPCTCTAGQAARDVHRRIIDANAAELRRLGRTAHVDATPPPSPDYRTWGEQ